MEIISSEEFGAGNHPETAKAKTMMKPQKNGCDYRFCRGLSGECPFSLINNESLGDGIKQIVENSALGKASLEQESRNPSHHRRLRVALAACPNACTQPQIKDIGIIAKITPDRVGLACDGCGQCESVCREQAIAVRDGRAQLAPENCVGCGQCVGRCPRGIIEHKETRFCILVGGRMGRHPKWADELCVVDSALVAGMVAFFLDEMAQKAEPGERVAGVVEKAGPDRLKKEVLP